MRKVSVGVSCLLLGAFLIMSSISGLLWPQDDRHSLSKTSKKDVLSYDEALARIDDAYVKYGASRAFLKNATLTYSQAIFYVWPRKFARVHFSDNWILWSLSGSEHILYSLGLIRQDNVFSHYETMNFRRAMRRGFGICSQNALGLTDLLTRQYNLNVHMVGLEGHVVTEVRLDDGRKFTLDPSAGLVFDFSVSVAQKNQTILDEQYSLIGQSVLAKAYDASGNLIFPEPGARGYRPRFYLIEKVSETAKWVIPIALLILGLGLLMRPSPKTGST